MKTIIESMKEKNDKIAKKLKDRRLFNRIYVWEKDPVLPDVDIDVSLQRIVKLVPKNYFNNIDTIFIGQFPELSKRNLNALYQDNAIYVSNMIMDTSEFMKNIVHELAHAVHDEYCDLVDENDAVMNEFFVKRRQLKKILHLNGYNVENQNFENLEYDQNFDTYLYQEIGYPIMHTLTINLFVSPYAATSYKEYFANGFEHYYLNDFTSVKQVSPKLFSLLTKIESIE
jgi:hypothetical protein